jgi:TonB family protein
VRPHLESAPGGSPTAPTSYRLLVEAERVRRRRLTIATLLAMTVTALAFWNAPNDPPLSELNARRFGYFGPTRLLPDIELRRETDPDRGETAAGTALRAMSLSQEAGGTEPRAPNPEGPAPGEVPRMKAGLEGTIVDELKQVEIPVVQSTDVVIEHLVEPVYPREARTRELEARVELAALVGEDGRVLYIRVIRNTGHPMFEEAAKEALLKCLFRPYREGGKPAKVWVRYPVRFDIIEADEEKVRAIDLLE